MIDSKQNRQRLAEFLYNLSKDRPYDFIDRWNDCVRDEEPQRMIAVTDDDIDLLLDDLSPSEILDCLVVTFRLYECVWRQDENVCVGKCSEGAYRIFLGEFVDKIVEKCRTNDDHFVQLYGNFFAS